MQTQVGERERAMPLRERVSEIFKKYGLMVTAIFLAAGVTIGAVVGTITKALKKCGEKMGDGLKTIGAKVASALPGLIGAIVSFIFKAAGSVISFFAKHSWLLILAVVVFLFEELWKRRCKRDAINNRATTPTTSIIIAVLLISCCFIFSERVSSFGGFPKLFHHHSFKAGLCDFGLGD